jgi:hypothetical protein
VSEEEELNELLKKADAGTRAAFKSAAVARYKFKSFPCIVSGGVWKNKQFGCSRTAHLATCMLHTGRV